MKDKKKINAYKGTKAYPYRANGSCLLALPAQFLQLSQGSRLSLYHLL